MKPFTGFTEGKQRLTPIFGAFFRELLPQIDHLGELKVVLYTFYRLDRIEGTFRYLERDDYARDEPFLAGLPQAEEDPQAALDEALSRAVRRGALLEATLTRSGQDEKLYFLNTPKGRAAVKAIQTGQWRSGAERGQLEVLPEPPNIFRLYEENIGPLTPMLADALTETEAAYPAAWIEEAFRITVERNIRNLSYTLAILERWKREGRDDRKSRQDSENDRRKYVEGEYSDFIEH